ncbi:transposase [Rhodococcus marinonascens]|uniref:transposase n=1 Tax=Rhodococcus marinonascens TaxID=38311 RepID=UPI0009334EBA|nr:transposase [Rhodococcus marinonascens]
MWFKLAPLVFKLAPLKQAPHRTPLTLRPAKYSDEQIEEALALVAAGVPLREIGRRMGCAGNTVRAWVAQAQAV